MSNSRLLTHPSRRSKLGLGEPGSSPRKSTLSAAIGAAALLLAVPPAAQAALMLAYSETELTTSEAATATFTDGLPGNVNPAAGVLAFPNSFNPLPGFVVNGSVHTAVGSPIVPGSTDMLTGGSSSVANGSAGPVGTIVSVGAAGFSSAGLLDLTSGSGTFTGAGDAITLDRNDDATNTQGANSATDTPGTRLQTFSLTDTATDLWFSNNANDIAVNNPHSFSTTLPFRFTVLPGNSLFRRGQSKDVVPSVPEPGSMLLLVIPF